MTRNEAVRQFEPINDKFAEYDREGVRGDFSNVSYQDASHFVMTCLAYIEAVAGPGSVYSRTAQLVVGNWQPTDPSIIPLMFGVAQALNDNMISGFVSGIEAVETDR